MKFDAAYLLSGKYARWICIALIALLSILIISEWFTIHFSQPIEAPVTVSSMAVAVETKKDNFESLLKSSLFGVHLSENLDEMVVTKTLLNINLVGVLFADKIDESQAIVSTATGEEQTYKIGDTLPGGAVLKRVLENGILVLREGNLESLSLPVDALSFDPMPEPLSEE